jgi:MoaA/NifB/PqqE/SkfB family radical SAM enzyme
MAIFNINICRNNMDDVRELTEIAYAHGISTDYHVNETPMIEQHHFKHYRENPTYLLPEDYPRVDALLDELIEKHNKGYIMVNSIKHLADMKRFMRGEVQSWRCLAGQNTLVIRTDGTLSPCFPMYSASTDWGVVGAPRFDEAQLDRMKQSCNAHCLSTCQYSVGYYFNNRNVLWTIAKQLLHGHQGDSTAGLSQN